MSIPSAAQPDPAPTSTRPTSPMRIAFARVLATRSDRRDIVVRLRAGHEPDQHGWCRHSAHAHRWEKHPCAIIGLAELIDAADPTAADPSDVLVRGLPARRDPS